MSIEDQYIVLGSILLKNERIATADLQVTDFVSPWARAIFVQLDRNYKHGLESDVCTIWSGIQEYGEHELVQNLAEITSLLDYGTRSYQLFSQAIDAIKKESRVFALREFAQSIIDTDESQISFEKTLEKARLRLRELEEKIEVVESPKLMPEVIDETYQELQRLWLSTDEITGITTGLKNLDKMIDGLQRGDLITLAGRPGQGKTLLAQQLAIAASAQQLRVEFVTLEMATTPIGMRMIAATADCLLTDLRHGTFRTREAVQAVADAQKYLKTLSIRFTTTANTLGKLSSLARRARLSRGIDLLIIDQLAAMPIVNKKKTDGIGEITCGLKGLAKELGIPIVLLHQLNRDLTKGADKRPDLQHLKDSGAVEQDSDVVLFVHREFYFDSAANPHDLEIIQGKNRIGQRGDSVHVGIDLAKSKITDYPPYWSDQQKNVPDSDGIYV